MYQSGKLLKFHMTKQIQDVFVYDIYVGKYKYNYSIYTMVHRVVKILDGAHKFVLLLHKNKYNQGKFW